MKVVEGGGFMTLLCIKVVLCAFIYKIGNAVSGSGKVVSVCWLFQTDMPGSRGSLSRKNYN